MDTNAALSAFDALSQPTRLDIFRLLIKAGPDGLPAGDIAEAVDGKQNTVSSHLATLARSGLIAAERQGRVIRYAASYKAAGDLVAFLLQDCCNGSPQVCAPLVQTLDCLQPASLERCCD